VNAESFLDWVREEFLPLPRRFDCYDVADRMCISWTMGETLDPDTWLPRLEAFRTADGCYIEREPSHDPWHTTAFALAAMQLCDHIPEAPAAFAAYRDPSRAVAFLDALDWRSSVYGDSHRGAALCSIAALAPGFVAPGWFEAVFAALDRRVDAATGLMGCDKPATGDLDQIGGTFHYHFVYEHEGRPLPHPEARIDTVLGLQQADGLWHPLNPVWLTLDAVYLMTRTVPQLPARRPDVEAAVRRVLDCYAATICTPEFFTGPLAAHSCTAVVSLLAEAQRFLGADVVESEHPLRLVLDERPFI
jgi:hypothetical protein